MEIQVSFNVSKRWLQKLSEYKKLVNIMVGYLDTATMNIADTEMHIDGFKSRLVADTSYGGLWEVVLHFKKVLMANFIVKKMSLCSIIALL